MVTEKTVLTDCAAENEKYKDMYKKACEDRRFELKELWTRLTFFVVFISAVFVALTGEGLKDNPFEQYLLCLAGIVVSEVYYLAAAAAKYWSENGETKVRILEKELGYYLPVASGEIIETEEEGQALLTNSVLKSPNIEYPCRPSLAKLAKFLAVCSALFFAFYAGELGYDNGGGLKYTASAFGTLVLLLSAPSLCMSGCNSGKKCPYCGLFAIILLAVFLTGFIFSQQLVAYEHNSNCLYAAHFDKQ